MPPEQIRPEDSGELTTHLPVALDHVLAARERITHVVVRTPIVPSSALSEHVGASVGLKLESLQPTGSFKVRGAAARILAEPGEVADLAGVVTASTGNHGRAVAHVARQLGVDAVVCVSDHVPAGKVAALQALDCEVRVGGDSQAEALGVAAELVDERGVVLVHPFDDVEVVAGQGTIGLEVIDQQPDTTTVLVPLSGGGLLAGIATAIKATRPDVRVVGVSMRHGAVMAASLEAGHPVDMPESTSLADSLQGGIGLDNGVTFPIVRELVDEVVLIDEDDIWAAMGFALSHHRLALEGAGAVGIAALLTGAVDVGGPATVVCSGANVELDHLATLATGGANPLTT